MRVCNYLNAGKNYPTEFSTLKFIIFHRFLNFSKVFLTQIKEATMKHSLLLLAIFLLCLTVFAQEKPFKDSKKHPLSNSEAISYVTFTPNAIRATIGNDARLFNSQQGGTGFEWPAASGKTAIFLSAPWIAARYEGDTSFVGIRTAAVLNFGRAGTEYQPGKTAYNAAGQLITLDPLLPAYRIYRIRRGDTTSSDFQNWPVTDGAPVNAQGRPLLTGEESLWSVGNDLKTPRQYSAQPLGVELQQYVYGFNSSSIAGRAIYVSYRIINRNPRNPNNPNQGSWRSAYIGMFSDADLGTDSDDLVGCDSLIELGYTYNATNNDVMYGAAPPAVGMMCLEAKRNKMAINLNAHVRFTTGGGSEGDPEAARPDHLYNFLRGQNKNGQPLGFTQPGSSFMFPGDPETGLGIIESPTTAADKRNLIVAGPIDVFAQDTLSFTYVFLISSGTNNLNSVTRLKQDARALRTFSSAKDSKVSTNPKTFALKQNYPNPFNPSTVISYQLSGLSEVKLEIFDVLGRQVATVVNARQAAGYYQASFNATSLASGIYFYRLQAGSFVESKKMLLVK
jgi:hypothetical protein